MVLLFFGDDLTKSKCRFAIDRLKRLNLFTEMAKDDPLNGDSRRCNCTTAK